VRVVMFYHSLISDWNHGNAHFLRGVARNLQQRGHQVDIYEPEDSWSVANLVSQHGRRPIADFQAAYPDLRSTRYNLRTLPLSRILENADLVLVHEWNDPQLVARIGEIRARQSRFILLFHDTHHRSVTNPKEIAAYDLRHYDGVLAYGRVIRERYLSEGWAARAWTWHEGADTTVFKPAIDRARDGDIVWIGNWADEERAEELREFLLNPVAALGLRATVHGVRYPKSAIVALTQAGINYQGWLPNFEVPRVFSRYALTVHVPRRPYAASLPGIPTIRPFEAMACGIPLISAPWDDVEGLFTPGQDFRVARNEAEMRTHISELLDRPDLARAMARRARRTILSRHTCAHRVDELLAICGEITERQPRTAVSA
jgi:spore maturation protein CgeB